MKFKKLIAIASAAVICLSLAACGNSGSKTSSSVNPNTSSVSATLTESWEFTAGFYPVITSSNSTNYGSTYWNRNFYNTLVCYDDSGEIQGELAEDWETSVDGLTYTFSLRDGVKFSDGTLLTAGTVKTSMEAAIKNLGIHNGSCGKLSSIITSIEVLDDLTFVMTLSQPYYGALNDLTMCNPLGIVNPAGFNEDMTPKDSFIAQTYGTGPYMYAGDFDGSTYTFVRNTYYWGEAPELDSFKVKVIEDNDAKVLALRSGEIDAIIGTSRLSYDAFNELSKDDSYTTTINDRGMQTRYLGFNLSNTPFNDIRVRQAVAYALDNDTLCTSVFQGIEKSANSMFEADKPYCDVESITYSFDLDKANALMDEAGWIDSDGDGVREKDGQTLELAIPYMQSLASLDDAVLTIASQLSEIGFKITPSGADMMTWFGIIAAGDYEITMYCTYGGAYDPSAFATNMNSDISQDASLIQISSFLDGCNALIFELDNTSDLDRVQDIYAEILGTIADRALMIPVSYTREFAAWNSNAMAKYNFLFDSQYVNIAGIHIS
ncbi:MAG: ABC transporter substrate-binding protein [Acetanaerobacterium sp.]